MLNESRRSSLIRSQEAVCLICATILIFGSSISCAQSGVRITVKEVPTHIALKANVTLRGPQILSIQTNDAGRATVTLNAGEYVIEVSAPSHKTLRTHYRVGQDGNLPLTIFLESDSLPDEERPENINSRVRPGFTLLHGYTVDAATGKPIEGVKVSAPQSKAETETDSNGHFLLSVPTPRAQYPGGIGTETLIFEKAGYSTEEYDNFGVTGDEMGGEGFEMEKGNQVHKHDTAHKD